MSGKTQQFSIHFSSDEESYSSTRKISTQGNPKDEDTDSNSYDDNDYSNDSSLEFAVKKNQYGQKSRILARRNMNSPIASPLSSKQQNNSKHSSSNNSKKSPQMEKSNQAILIENVSSDRDFTSNQLYSNSDYQSGDHHELPNDIPSNSENSIGSSNSPKIKIGAMDKNDQQTKEYSEEASLSKDSQNDVKPKDEEKTVNLDVLLQNQKETTTKNETEQFQQKEKSESPYQKAYFCSKLGKIGIRSHFVFKLESNSIFFALPRGMLANTFYISSNESMNVKKKEYEYKLSISQNKTHYVLTKKNEKANPRLTISFNNDYGKEYGPRKICMTWPQTGIELKSKIPRKKHSGAWELDFQGKFVLLSQKNAIILNQKSKPSIFIRKIAQKLLELEVNHEYEAIDLCALAIASFICPL